MSTWHVRAIERLGTPLPTWPTIWGPADPGVDALAANGLHTVDLTPFLAPLSDFSSTLERDLTKASFGSVNLDLVDADETLAVLLGPASATLATSTRYCGPWIEITEVWGTGSAVRWTGYLDETSLQWDENEALTRATVLHASQLLLERRLSDLTGLLRPYPSLPTTATQSFSQSTADALMDTEFPAYTPRANAVALEAALWAAGKLSWMVSTYRDEGFDVGHPEYGGAHSWDNINPPPAAPSSTLSIGGTSYSVASIEWDMSFDWQEIIVYRTETQTITSRVARVVLQGAPDLTGLLTLGATVNWGIAEYQRTHYVLAENVPAPASGSDGQRWMKLTYVEQLVAGDKLTITFVDTSNGAPRKTTLEVTIIDVDGEQGRVWLLEPLAQALSTAAVLKIRRNSQNPVLFDGVAFARSAVAPWTLDTTYLVPARTSRPVLSWLPHDAAAPQFYGVHSLQTINRAGSVRLARRGAFRSSDSTYPLTGIWEGSWAGGFTWLGSAAASTVAEILGDLNQWPTGSNAYRPPVIYLQGDLSAGATIPPNGWRSLWRTWKDPLTQTQDAESWWNGTTMQWASQTPAGVIPAKLVAYTAQTATPGRYTRTSAPVWSFEAHTGDGTLGTASTPTITGTLPTGSWLALGMGIYRPAASDEQEALLGLVAANATQPFGSVRAVVLSQASGGNLTVRQDVELWATGAVPSGAWAVGGGLVVQTVTETVDGVAFPRTILHKLDGTNHLTLDLRTLEVIPQTIQPLSLAGTAGSRVVAGWHCLALETYLDDAFAPARRLRLLWIGSGLTVLNGEFEADPADPLNEAAAFRRGDLIAEVVPDGALACRMVRTGEGDRMVGFVGGRLFQLSYDLPTTVEHLDMGESATPGEDASGLSVAEYLEQFASSILASAIPDATGNISLVSRSSGIQRLRQTGPTTGAGVQAFERSARRTIQVHPGYASEIRVGYTDDLTGEDRQVVVVPDHAGGKPMTLDMGDLIGGATAARAIGEAAAFWFGKPSGVINETWVDRTGGTAQDQDPPFWASWQIGDLITFTSFLVPTSTPVDFYKLHVLTPGAETRSADVELLKMPEQIVPTPGWV